MENIRKVCSKKLRELAVNLTPQDKLDAMDHLDISRVTLDRYLTRENPSKIETAMRLIQFLEERVNGRINELQKQI